MKNKLVIYLALVFSMLFAQNNTVSAVVREGSSNGIHEPGTGITNPKIKELNQNLNKQNKVEDKIVIELNDETTDTSKQVKERERLQDGTSIDAPEQKRLHIDTTTTNRFASTTNSIAVRSEVANAIQAIIQIADRNQNIGEQIRIIAQAQIQNQEKIETGLQKIQSRNKIKNFFIGSDYKEINSTKTLIQQNREQVKQLNQIQDKLSNQKDLQNIQQQIQILEKANIELENQIKTSENNFSLLGWMFKWLSK